MLNKRGIIVSLLISFLFLVLIIAGFSYLKVRFFDGLEFKSGNLVFKIAYERDFKELPNETVQSNSQKNQQKLNSTNLTVDNQSIIFDNVTAD